MRLRLKTNRLLLTFLALWVAGVGAGFARLLEYAATPGETGSALSWWPTNSPIAPLPCQANLVLLAHPRCPCTRATLDELERLMARCQGLLAAHVLFCRPAGFTGGWEQTDLWRQAAAIPGVHVLTDDEGAGARCFGAATSGQVLLFGADGRLLFHGGITNGRGHSGSSTGADAIIGLLTAGPAGPAETPVFGCPLFDPAGKGVEGDKPCCK